MSGRAHERYDEEAVERTAVAAKAGDRTARNLLFMQNRGLIWRSGRSARRILAASRTDSALQPEDIDQQAFVEFCMLLDEWQPGSVPFLAYISKMLPWRLLHYIRRAMHYRSRVRMVRLEQHGEAANDTDIEDEAAQRKISRIESSDTWKYHTDPLDGGLREAVRLRYGLGLSSREIAQVQGRSRRTVDRELRAAIAAIKCSIADEWEDCS